MARWSGFTSLRVAVIYLHIHGIAGINSGLRLTINLAQYEDVRVYGGEEAGVMVRIRRVYIFQCILSTSWTNQMFCHKDHAGGK